MRRVLMSLAALVGLTTVGLAAVPAVAGAGGSPTPVVVTPADLVTATAPTAGQFFVDDEGDGSGGVSIVEQRRDLVAGQPADVDDRDRLALAGRHR